MNARLVMSLVSAFAFLSGLAASAQEPLPGKTFFALNPDGSIAHRLGSVELDANGSARLRYAGGSNLTTIHSEEITPGSLTFRYTARSLPSGDPLLGGDAAFVSSSARGVVMTLSQTWIRGPGGVTIPQTSAPFRILVTY